MTVVLGVTRGAEIRGAYRYLLWRRWGPGPTCLFVMLNPSTADARTDDSTIKRCIGFARREGCGALEVVNLFAFRSRDPEVLDCVNYPVGAENDAWIKARAKACDGPIIAAWGNRGIYHGRSQVVRKMLERYPVYTFGLTKQGEPKHPLYLPLDQPLVPFGADHE